MKPVLIYSALVLAAASASAAPKVSRDLPLNSNAPVDVIVQYTSTPDDNDDKEIKGKGGKTKRKLHVVKGVAAQLPAKALEALAKHPKVAYISPDRPVPGMLDTTTVTVGAPAAWQLGLEGTGIAVAVIDSGLAAGAEDFQPRSGKNSRVVYSEDFTGSNSTLDGFGHGTHVAGIAAGSGKKSNGVYRGVAPDAKIVNLRVLDDKGVGRDSWVIAAIQRVIELKSQFNIRVLNLSLGRPVWEGYRVDPLCQAVEAAWRAGIVVVVSAGNSGRDNSQVRTVTAPSRHRATTLTSSPWAPCAPWGRPCATTI